MIGQKGKYVLSLPFIKTDLTFKIKFLFILIAKLTQVSQQSTSEGHCGDSLLPKHPAASIDGSTEP